MSGRDAYLELGYHQKSVKTPTNPKSEPTNAIEAPGEPLAENKFMALDSTPYTAVRPLSETPVEPPKTGDYVAGLLLIMFVLIAGLASGYFGRGWINPTTPSASDMTVLSSTNQSAEGSSALIFGSTDSDQVLAMEPLENGDAVMLVKSHFGPNASDTETRLMRMNAAASSNASSQLTELSPLEGTGLHLTRLGDGTLIALSAQDSEVIVSRVSTTGEKVWSLEFASNPLDRAEVAIVPDMNGFVFMAPSSDRAFSQIVSISAAGDIAWQKQFDRARGWQPAFITLDGSGQTYAVLGAASSDQAFGDQSIAIINSNGEMLRQKLLPLDADEVIAGATVRGDGGVTYLISGPSPRLLYLDATGQSVGTIDLPHMQYFSDAKLQTIANGDTLIASTYALMGDRVDLMLEQKTADGVLLGQSSHTLPAGAKLDDLIQIDDETYLAIGSARSERYRPTDLFLQRVTFTPADLQMASVASVDLNRAAPVAAQEESPAAITLESAEITTASAEASDALPIIASLTLAATDELPEATTSETLAETSEPIATETTTSEDSVEAIEVESALELTETEATDATEPTDSPETVLDVERGVEFVVDENAAALSRFFDESIVTQCRFTCLDPSTASTFPMTGHFLPALLADAADASTLHARVCESADLAPDFQTRPVCGIN